MGLDEQITEESNIVAPSPRGRATSRPNLADAQASELRFRRSANMFSSIQELWSLSPLLRSFFEHQLRSRHKQAIPGFAWALDEPVLQRILTAIDDNNPIAPMRHR